MKEIVKFPDRITPTSKSTSIDEDKISDLLKSVGGRVRNARAKRGISRRFLAERSGVSQRYLAQLEGGHGNISIALLLRIAEALDFRIEWLLVEEDPWNSEVAAIANLLRSATKQQRATVLEILDSEHPRLRRANRIALTGLRGAGKSTLGRLCAGRLGLPFIELNEKIEEASGMPVDEVMALYGQEGYRRLESQSLERIVATHDSLILAVAGGIVSQPETFNYLLRNFHTIWLKAEPEEHMARVRGQGDERPMSGHPDAIKELRSILASRETLYSKANAQVDTSKATLEESLEAVIDAITVNKFIA